MVSGTKGVTIKAVLGVALAVLGVVAVQVGLSTKVSAVDIRDLSTGSAHACAVVEYAAKCWGNNASGQLGNGSSSTSTQPVSVYTRSSYDESVKDYCRNGVDIGGNCIGFGAQWVYKTVNRPASPLHNKTVTKISAGLYHTCAVANARAFCWGNGGNGRLGIGSSEDQSRPVAVAISGALRDKEVVDIAAGSNFTCALATDGTVACWGDNADGQLGTGNRTASNVPVAVSMAGGSALQNDKAKKLSVVSSFDDPTTRTMCVVTRSDQAVCWGHGIDDGRPIPPASSETVACNKDSRTSRPANENLDRIIFSSTLPRLIPGAKIASMNGERYVTGLGTDGKAYYWGQYGYSVDATYDNIVTCKVNPCTGKVVIQRDDKAKILLAANGKPPTGSGGLNKKKSSTGQGFNGKPGMATYTRYDGNDNNNSNGACSMTRTHYGYKKNITNTPIGEKKTTTPSLWPQSQAGITAFSGNSHDRLFCAVIGGTAQCDAHGGDTRSGQLGNGKTSQLTGPQAVVTSGWLAGKQISRLSTGSTGYTCAVAGGGIGCWGINKKGQLGIGSTDAKSVPTAVRL